LLAEKWQLMAKMARMASENISMWRQPGGGKEKERAIWHQQPLYLAESARNSGSANGENGSGRL